MLWAKVLVPTLLVLGGTGAAAVGIMADDAPADAAQVWIDGPVGEAAYAPGTIAVSAHGTAPSTISALELLVDGDVVDTDRTLERTELLVFATFEWKATDEGEHELVVRQVGGAGSRSDARFLTIAEGGAPAPKPEATTTTSTTVPGETTTSSTSSTTTSTTQPGETTTTAPSGGTVVPTAPPPAPTTPTPTTPLPSPVAIDAATLSSSYPENRLYTQRCGYVVQVNARIRNAEYADAVVQGTGVVVAMSSTGSSSWTATLSSGPPLDASDVGTRTIVVVAGRGDDVTDRQAGTVDIRPGCPKD